MTWFSFKKELHDYDVGDSDDVTRSLSLMRVHVSELPDQLKTTTHYLIGDKSLGNHKYLHCDMQENRLGSISVVRIWENNGWIGDAF